MIFQLFNTPKPNNNSSSSSNSSSATSVEKNSNWKRTPIYQAAVELLDEETEECKPNPVTQRIKMIMVTVIFFVCNRISWNVMLNHKKRMIREFKTEFHPNWRGKYTFYMSDIYVFCFLVFSRLVWYWSMYISVGWWVRTLTISIRVLTWLDHQIISSQQNHSGYSLSKGQWFWTLYCFTYHWNNGQPHASQGRFLFTNKMIQ